MPRFPKKMFLNSSTNLSILKPWAIISNLIRLNINFSQVSKQFYRKFKYRETVLEEFQRLPHFPRKMVLFSWNNFRILKPCAIIYSLISFDLGFWQASKPFYRKLKNREKIFEEFQDLRRFPGKMVLNSSTNFCILSPWGIISNHIRFDLGFSQASKPFDGKVKYWEKVLEEFQRLPHFPRIMILYSSTSFSILKPWAILSNFIRFDLGFWEAWKPFYRKLKYREKVFQVFQRLRPFPRKMALYSSTNFCILKPWSIISNLIRLDLGFW